jgi:ATP-dependent Lhr-like helicase
MQPWGKILSHLKDRSFMNLPGTAVALSAGRPAAILERQGKVLRVFEPDSLADTLDAFSKDYHRKRIFPSVNRIVVKQYPADADEALTKAGFLREFNDYVLYRSHV